MVLATGTKGSDLVKETIRPCHRMAEHTQLASLIQTRDQLIRLRVSLINKAYDLFNRHGIKKH